MKKIPTVFERDWNGDRSRVVDQVRAGCEWVLAGEGKPTAKLDGTCCMVRGARLYKRRELKATDVAPDNFDATEYDPETEKTVGWVPVGEGPEDRYHREAWAIPGMVYPDGTYELLGPKVQGNPEHAVTHVLIPHSSVDILVEVPRTFDGLREWLTGKDMEGIVFHHPDGRMAKIKLRDFGLKRATSPLSSKDGCTGHSEDVRNG